MSQYVYLVNKYPDGVLEIIDGAIEPRSSLVLDFLDLFAKQADVFSDESLSLKDVGVIRHMEGRLIPAKKISQAAMCKALVDVSAAHKALTECFKLLSLKPELVFEKAPSGKKNWNIVREFFDLRILFLQAASKRNFSIAICHD